MKDLLARLADENPVAVCETPCIDAIWAAIDALDIVGQRPSAQWPPAGAPYRDGRELRAGVCRGRDRCRGAVGAARPHARRCARAASPRNRWSPSWACYAARRLRPMTRRRSSHSRSAL